MNTAENNFIPRYARKKTILRGRIHQIACFISIAWLFVYIAISIVKYFKNKKINESGGINSTISKILILSTQVILYGCSAIYHRLSYNKWLQRLDHFCIFVFISSVHTSVLLGMLQKKRKKEKKILIEGFNPILPTAKDLQFRLHPNPFSINSPMRNTKDNRCGFDLSLSQIESTESNEKNITHPDKCRDISLGNSNIVSEQCLSDNSFFDFSIQKPRNYSVSDHKNQTEAGNLTSVTESAVSSYNSKDDPTTDLSANLSTLSYDTTEKTISSDNITDEKDKDHIGSDMKTINDKEKLPSQVGKSIAFDNLSSNKIEGNTTSDSKMECNDQNHTQKTCTQFSGQNATDQKGESYDSSLDTTLNESQIFDTSQSVRQKSKEISKQKNRSVEKEKSKDHSDASFDQKSDLPSMCDENIDIRRPLIGTWLFCLFGLVKILLQKEINELIDVPLYILHGAHLVFTCPFKRFPRIIVSSFASGGACYILGGILFGFEFPNWKNSFFGFHEFFHVMTVLGNMCFLVPIIFNFQLIE